MSFLDCMETMILDEEAHDEIFRKVKRYNGHDSFGRKLVLRQQNSMIPYERWVNFGIEDKALERLAISIFSQTCSSNDCERNWNVFEQIHTKKKNRSEHKKLNDVVFTHYNLRLKDR